MTYDTFERAASATTDALQALKELAGGGNPISSEELLWAKYLVEQSLKLLEVIRAAELDRNPAQIQIELDDIHTDRLLDMLQARAESINH